MDHFQAFADWLAEHLPTAEVTFHEKPFFGKPWIQIDQREFMDRWTLMLDEGQTFNIGDDTGRVDAWITEGRKP
jgi:hypothetical protein